MREGEEQSRAFAKRLRREMPRSEALLWSYIRKRALHGARFRRQHPVGPYVADFACVAAKLSIEVDGYTHWTPEQLEHDARRTSYLVERGWRVLRQYVRRRRHKRLHGVQHLGRRSSRRHLRRRSREPALSGAEWLGHLRIWYLRYARLQSGVRRL